MMNEPIIVTYANYEYCIRWQGGKHYTAECLRTGRIKMRLNTRCWRNEVGGLLNNADLIDALEDGVSQCQRQHTPKGPRPPVVSGGEWHAAPTVRSKGRVSNRESRGRGRAE